MITVSTDQSASYTHSAWKTRPAGKIGGRVLKRVLRIPDEYVCDMCGFMFLSGETINIFCPECGSSMVAKEISFDEFLDEEAYNFNSTIITK